MHSNNPVNQKLLNVTLLAILTPLYAMVLLTPEIGVLRNLAKYWSLGTPFAAPLLYVFALAYLISIIWLLWRGTLVGPVTLLLLTMVANGITTMGFDSEKTYTLSIGAGNPILGIDVYCNDVHLGKTPFTISEADFNKKVTPWDTPPDQPIMTLGNHDENDRYSSAKFFYVPHDIFEQHKQWPPDHMRYNRDTDKETLEEFKQSQYWWRFEQDGCVGLTSLSNFSNGSGGSNNRITIDINPNLTFLSAKEHLDVLLTQLQADNLQPTRAWLDHFLKYKELLFTRFYQQAMDDESLQPTLDTIVRAAFNLSTTPTESECRQVVNEIVSRTAKSGCFTVPSLDSLGIVMVAEAHSQPVIDCFLEPLEANLSGLNSDGTRGSGALVTYRRSGPRAKLLPLEYAIKQTAPPQLFDHLVYMARGGDHMDLLGNYPREELVWLFSHYLRNVEQQGGHMRDMRINRAIELCSQIANPLLEDKARQFVRENGEKQHGIGRHYVGQFIESRIDNPKIKQGELANWIFHWAPLDDHAKMAFLQKIQDPNACNYVSMIFSGGRNRHDNVIYELGNTPNPAFDTFIIDTCKSYKSQQSPGSWSRSLTLALVKTDTPAIHEFIKETWNESGKTRSQLINRLNSGDWHQPHIKWLVPLIAELTEKHDRTSAARLLSRIDTPEAYGLAEQWATDSDSDIAAAATAQLEIHDQRIAQNQQQLALAADLLAGTLKPDDLLSSTVAYTWNGTKYIPDNVIP
jgi:hypothetical protein